MQFAHRDTFQSQAWSAFDIMGDRTAVLEEHQSSINQVRAFITQPERVTVADFATLSATVRDRLRGFDDLSARGDGELDRDRVDVASTYRTIRELSKVIFSKMPIERGRVGRIFRTSFPARSNAHLADLETTTARMGRILERVADDHVREHARQVAQVRATMRHIGRALEEGQTR